jgi:hypothetical protein
MDSARQPRFEKSPENKAFTGFSACGRLVSGTNYKSVLHPVAEVALRPIPGAAPSLGAKLQENLLF